MFAKHNYYFPKNYTSSLFKGIFLTFTGGDIGYFKNELDSQINVPLAGWNNVNT